MDVEYTVRFDDDHGNTRYIRSTDEEAIDATAAYLEACRWASCIAVTRSH